MGSEWTDAGGSPLDLTVYTTILFLGLEPAEWSWTYVGLIGAHGMFWGSTSEPKLRR